MPQAGLFEFGWPSRQPSHFVLSSSPVLDGFCVGILNQNFEHTSGAAAFGSQVQLFSVIQHGGQGRATACSDAGVAVSKKSIIRGQVDLGVEPQELAQGQSLTVVRVDGGVHVFELAGEGIVGSPLFVPGAWKRLHGSASNPRVLAIGDSDIVAIKGGGLLPVTQEVLYRAPLLPDGGRAPLLAVDGGPAQILDAVLMEIGSSNEDLLVAMTDQGLFAMPVTWDTGGGTAFTHVTWESSGSSRTPGPLLAMSDLRLTPQRGGPPLLSVLARDRQPDGGSRVLTFNVSRQNDGGVAPTVSSYVPGSNLHLAQVPPAPRWTFEWVEFYASCPGAAQGWLTATDRSARSTQTIFQCAETDGGAALRRIEANPFSTLTPIVPDLVAAPLTPQARWRRNDARSVTMMDVDGLTVAESRGRDITLTPILPPEAPDAITGRIDDFMQLRVPARTLSLGFVPPAAVRPAMHYVSTGEGFLPTNTWATDADGGYDLVSGNSGQPDLATVRLPPSAGAKVVLVRLLGYALGESSYDVDLLARGPGSAEPQASSVVATSADAGLWFVSLGDQLHATLVGGPRRLPIQAASEDVLVPAPQARLIATPLPGARITHVRGLAPDVDGGASYGQALVVAAGRLFSLRADNPVVWRTSEPLITTAEIVETWTDGTRVRVGDRDGRVTSFPSRVALSPVLPNGARAWGFADVCGVTYALATNGLWRLAATAGVPVGTWAAVPLPAGLGFTGRSVLYTDGRELLVFDDRGRASRVTGLTCAQPL